MHILLVRVLMLFGAASLMFGQETGDAEPSFGTTVVLSAGLRGTVYLLDKDTRVLPDFEHDDLEKAGEIWTNTLNIPPRHWRAGFPGLTDRFEWFAIDYQGQFWVENPGRYSFALLSDDGSRLFIDGTPVIDDDCVHSPDLRVAAVRLEGGVHRIRVSYFQGPRDCLALLLAIAGPEYRWRVFNTAEFAPPRNPEEWHYSGASAMTIVPVTPAEASLTMKSLFARLEENDRRERFVIKADSTRGCAADAVRSCGK